MSTSVVLPGEVRLMRRSPIHVWLIASPTRSRSDIAPTPLTFSVDVTTPGEPLAKSGMFLGTSPDMVVTTHRGVGVTVRVGVDVACGVAVNVPHEPPIITLTSSMYQPSLETDGSVRRRKRKRTL